MAFPATRISFRTLSRSLSRSMGRAASAKIETEEQADVLVGIKEVAVTGEDEAHLLRQLNGGVVLALHLEEEARLSPGAGPTDGLAQQPAGQALPAERRVYDHVGDPHCLGRRSRRQSQVAGGAVVGVANQHHAALGPLIGQPLAPPP